MLSESMKSLNDFNLRWERKRDNEQIMPHLCLSNLLLVLIAGVICLRERHLCRCPAKSEELWNCRWTLTTWFLLGKMTLLYRGRRSDLLAANTMARLRANTESRASPISLGPILTQSDTNSPSLGLTTGQTATYLEVGRMQATWVKTSY